MTGAARMMASAAAAAASQRCARRACPRRGDTCSMRNSWETRVTGVAGDSTARKAAGALFVVATPIGNLQDLSPRAAATLREADLLLAEDTRHTRTLLEACG